jgi:hypothetical protein
VRREREALTDYLRGAYRDPAAVGRRLEELVDRQGWTSAAAHVAGARGELRGRRDREQGASAKPCAGCTAATRSWPVPHALRAPATLWLSNTTEQAVFAQRNFLDQWRIGYYRDLGLSNRR